MGKLPFRLLPHHAAKEILVYNRGLIWEGHTPSHTRHVQQVADNLCASEGSVPVRFVMSRDAFCRVCPRKMSLPDWLLCSPNKCLSTWEREMRVLRMLEEVFQQKSHAFTVRDLHTEFSAYTLRQIEAPLHIW